jgi:hypothetical protein
MPTTAPFALYDRYPANGTLGVWDAANTESWPSQSAPVVGAQTLKNLVESGALDANVSVDWTWDATRKGFTRPAATSARISLGAPTLGDTPRSVVGTAWVYVPAVPTAFTPIMSRLNSTSAAVDNQFALAIGADGKPRIDTISVDADGSTLRAAVAYAGSAITVGWHQMAWSITFATGNSATTALYVDGAQVGSSPYIGAKLNPSTLSIALGNRHGSSTAGSAAGIVYRRATLEDLSVSGKTAAARVLKDWDQYRGTVGL